VVRHIKFAENYRLYSRSHFVKAYALLCASKMIFVETEITHVV
jgi:hypothetical protein